MKPCSPTYVYSRETKLKTKVVTQSGTILQKGRLGIDRDTITLTRLRKHLTKIFRLGERSFTLTYEIQNSETEEEVKVISDDWELEVALQQPRLCLAVKIEVETPTKSDYDPQQDWDVHIIDNQDTKTPSSTTHRFTSLLDRFVDKVEELVFSNKDEEKDGPIPSTKPPMTIKEFHNYLDSEGRMINYQAFRENVYLGGISHSIRKIAWRHLLCVFPEGMTSKERLEYLDRRSTEYVELREKWKAEYEKDPNNISEHMRFVTSMVKKDVIRTDRNHKYYKGKEDNKHTVALFDLLCTYSLNHPDTSYCQGMCDLASPLLAVQDNEANAYLLFCSIMQRMKHNFSFDGKCMGVKFDHLTQLIKFFDPEFFNYMQENQVEDLLFTYRWLLLEMKREFPYADSLYFTEIMWSSLPNVPCDTEIPFKQVETPAASPSLPRKVSAYSKMNTLDCDYGSLSTRGSSVFSIYPDWDAFSIENSGYLDTCNSLEQISDDTAATTHPSVSSTTSPCHCLSAPESDSHNAVFYFELEGNDSPKQQCQCSKSIDSGYLSRPSSPVKPELLPQPVPVSTGRKPRLSQQFPPPKEFGYGNPFLLFAASAMILQQRDVIMENQMDFNDIVMLFNSYKCQHNVHTVLKEAKQLYEAYISDDLEVEDDDYVHIKLPCNQQHPTTTITA